MTRFIDRGALIAGWIGIGTAVIVVIAFGLVVPIQPIVYVVAVPVGVLIGWYANSKSERYRPRARALANALWAGLLTALALAVFYVAVRFVFIYADNGYPDFNQRDANGQPVGVQCDIGPACTYQRYLLAPDRGVELERAGVTDADSFTRFLLAEYATGGALLAGLVVGGAALAGAWRAIAPSAGGGMRSEKISPSSVPG